MEKSRLHVSTFRKEKMGQTDCGDSLFHAEKEGKFICAIADGLGSGKFAKASSEAVINVIQSDINATNEHIIERSNERLIGQRGVVLGVLRIDLQARTFTFSSIGNIGLMIVLENNKKIRNIPERGYLGSNPKQLKVMKGKLEPNMNFIMYSDGVSESELLQNHYLNKEVSKLVESFIHVQEKSRKDDTSLIAIRYEG